MRARQPTTPPIMAPMLLGLLMLKLLLLLVLLVLLVLPLLMSMSLLLLMSPLEPVAEEEAGAVGSKAEDILGGEVVETADLVVGAEEDAGPRVVADVGAAVDVDLVVGTGNGVAACFVVKAR